MERKRVRVDECNSKLLLIKCVKQCTKKSLYESKCIVDQIVPSYGSHQKPGVLLLNESSITPEQWEHIVEDYQTEPMSGPLKWKYV